MTNRHQSLIEGFEKKLRKLLQLHADDRAKNQQLAEQLQRKEEDLMQAHKVILELRSDYESLKMAQMFVGGNEDERELAHKRISQLVQEVDKCIDLLNQ
jgi:chromosome segregation ATPase